MGFFHAHPAFLLAFVGWGQVHGASKECPHAAPQGGFLEADVVVLPLPRDAVIKMLPDVVTLGHELDGLTTIPVTFSFGVQSSMCNSATLPHDKSWLDGRSYNLDYQEFIVTVPSVRFSNPKFGQITTSFSFQPRSYLDDEFAMVLGWVFQAVDKDQAHLTHDASGWSIRDFDTHDVTLSLNASSDSEWVPLLSLPENSTARLAVVDYLEAPLLGNAQGPPGIPEMFPMCTDRAAMLDGAQVQLLSGTVTVHQQLDILPAFNHSFDSRSGFRMRVNWTSGMPNDCTDAASFSTGRRHQALSALPPVVLTGSKMELPRRTKTDSGCTHPPGAGGGGGAYVADFVMALMSTKVISKMLPEGVQLPLELRIVPVTPVVFTFGYQYGVCDNSDSLPWLDGRTFMLNYNEFIMALPDVEFSNPPHGQSRGSYTFQPRLFLDEAVPMALGWGFGIDKVLAHFDHDPVAGKWSITDWDTKDEVLTLDTKNTTGWIPLPSLDPESLAGLLTQGIGAPILGMSGRGFKGDPHGQGFFVCGEIDFDLFDHAKVQLIRGEMKVKKPLDNEQVMHPMDTHFPIGVRLISNWTMSFPNDCTQPKAPVASRREAWVKIRDLLMEEEASSEISI